MKKERFVNRNKTAGIPSQGKGKKAAPFLLPQRGRGVISRRGEEERLFAKL